VQNDEQAAEQHERPPQGEDFSEGKDFIDCHHPELSET
jgi:hypothetical protein